MSTNPAQSVYSHRQRAPLYLILVGFSIYVFVMTWLVGGVSIASVILPSFGLLMFLLGMSFQYLSVSDEGDRLRIGFGPLPLFRRRVSYEDIRQVEVGRTMIRDGWGIHISAWSWNLWGRDCVVIHLARGTLRVGTDDAENLARFLEEKCGLSAT